MMPSSTRYAQGDTVHQPPPTPTRPPRWGRFIAWTAGAAIAACLAGAGIARLAHHGEGGGPVANPALCKAALTQESRRVMANGGKGPEASTPPACVGLDEKTLNRITSEVISEYLESDQGKKDMDKAVKDGMESALAAPSASTGVSHGRAACKKAIKAQYEPGTAKLKDGARGRPAECAGLSNDQLSRIVTSVIDENTQ
jgi:hypothetical protein